MNTQEIKPGQLYKLHTGPVVEVTEITEYFIHYEINGTPAKILKKHFSEMIKRKYAKPRVRAKKRENLGSKVAI